MSKIIDELDSLRDLLDADAEDSLSIADLPASTELADTPMQGGSSATDIPVAGLEDEAIPLLDEVVDVVEALNPPIADEAIPLLDEPAEQQDTETDNNVPSIEELDYLLETLLERRLERLKPQLLAELQQELTGIYPALFSEARAKD